MRPIAPAAACLCLLLGACAGPRWAVPSGGDARVESCRAVFLAVDRAVAAAGVRDAEAAPVPGFPYLRSNRFLASFRSEPLAGAARAAWVDRLRRLDRQARRVELANLPAADRRTLSAALGRLPEGRESLPGTVERCAAVLREHDMTNGAMAALRRAAWAPDSYATWVRLVGFYPVTSIAVAAGFAVWKRENLPVFELPAPPPAEGTLDAYRPLAGGPTRRLSTAEAAAIIAASRDNPLGIPEPRGRDLRRLVESFAPVWQVDRVGAADRIGHPVWRLVDGRPRVDVDVDRPVAFTRLSHVRFGGEILPQISYMVWFRERPRKSALDLLGGWLDAVVWRVTIALDGRPLVYDSIHACGCYHLFFPVPPLVRKPTPEDRDLREEALVAAPGPLPAGGQRVAVRLEAGSHYVGPVRALGEREVAGQAKTYRLLPVGEVPDQALRSAPLPPAAGGGHRGIYGPDGLVPGTERLERFLLWPMGIASPGALRQWGGHATAFVGRRHFDDPDLLEKAFRR